MKPISPAEVGAAKQEGLPPAVVEVWNRLVAAKFTGGSAVVKQNAAVEALASRMGCDRREVFENNWLDIEAAYEAEGWRVSYEKPGYNESGEAFFTFRAP